jgi:hypothetical protein
LDQQKVETTVYSLKSTPPLPSERRTSERYLSLLRVGSLHIGVRRELCLVRNISAGGMMIRAYSEIALGTSLSIELRQGDPINGVVRWVQNDLIGVTFDQNVDVIGLLSLTLNGQQARIPRIEVDCSAWIREGSDVQRARLLNISPGGICVEAPKPLTLDEDVVITLIGLVPAAAVVKWADRNCYGIGFNRKLPLPELVAWLREQQEKQRISA